MPHPAPGQLLANGQPARSTYSAAWDQQFAPLHDYERLRGRQIGTFRYECEKKYLQLMGLFGNWPAIDSMSILSERLGLVLQIKVRDTDISCKGAQQPCTSTGCPDSRCMLSRTEKHEHYLGSDIYDDTWVFDFKLPSEVEEKVEALREELSPLCDLIELREEAKFTPWKIFAESKTDVDADPRLKKLNKRVETARTKAAKYLLIDKDGQPSLDNLRNPESLVCELESIESALRLLKGQQGYGSVLDPGKTEIYKCGYDKHEVLLATILETEEKLGEPLPELLKNAALADTQMLHKTYTYGVLKGAKRRTAILNGRKRASDAVEKAVDDYVLLRDELHEQAEWGSGWPAGALNAPTREEWAKLIG